MEAIFQSELFWVIVAFVVLMDWFIKAVRKTRDTVMSIPTAIIPENVKPGTLGASLVKAKARATFISEKAIEGISSLIEARKENKKIKAATPVVLINSRVAYEAHLEELRTKAAKDKANLN